MKKTDLLEAMERMVPNSTAPLAHGANLVTLALSVAAKAFYQEMNDDTDAGILKEYLQFLEKYGYFEFDEDRNNEGYGETC